MTELVPTAGSWSGGLRRELGLGSAAAAVAGEAIAVGIFLTPAGMARTLGSPFWLLIVWLVMGGIALSGALCFGELAARYPEAGGLYVYLREAFGERVAFLYGWMSLLVMDPGVTAALAVGGAGYGAYIFGWSPLVSKLVAIATVAALCAINMLNTRAGAGFLRYITWLKLGVLGLIVVWALVFRLGSWSHFVPFVAQRSGSSPLLPAIAGALVAAFYSYGGWWDVSKVAGEIKDPARTLPRALALGVMAVVAAYVLVSGVFIYLVPPVSVTSDHTFVAQAGAILFGPAGANLLGRRCRAVRCGRYGGDDHGLSAGILRDGGRRCFLKSVAQLHPRYGTPVRPIGIMGVMTSLLISLGAFEQIIAYFLFVAVLFIGLTVCALFVFRRRSIAAPVRTPGYPVTPLIFLVQVVALLALILMNTPWQALLGCAVVLLGLPVYTFLQREHIVPSEDAFPQ